MVNQNFCYLLMDNHPKIKNYHSNTSSRNTWTITIPNDRIRELITNQSNINQQRETESSTVIHGWAG